MSIIFIILIFTAVIFGGMLCGIILAYSDGKSFHTQILPKPILFPNNDQLNDQHEDRPRYKKYGFAH